MNALLKVRSGRGWVLGLVLLGLALPVAAQAGVFSYINGASGLAITGYNGPGGNVVVPAIIDGQPVRRIGDSAFKDITSITGMVLPASIVSIGDEAFGGCTRMTRITIPGGSIHDAAFDGCTGLRTIKLGAGIEEFGHVVLVGCTSLTAIDVSAQNPVYSSVDGVMFNKAKTVLVRIPPGKSGRYTVPKSVTVFSGASGCHRLTGVQMGNRVGNIWYGAFSGCTRLTGVMIGNGLTSIVDRAFSSCPSLTTVAIGGNAPAEGEEIFSDSPLVTVYYLPWTTGWGATFGGRPTKMGDRYEPDNSKSAAQVIRNGKTQIHCIHAAGNADWVKFTVGGAGARNLRLETIGASGDTEMWLYRSSGRQIAYDNDSGTGRFSRIRVASLSPGTYYAKIRGFGNGTVPFFRVAVSWKQR